MIVFNNTCLLYTSKYIADFHISEVGDSDSLFLTFRQCRRIGGRITDPEIISLSLIHIYLVVRHPNGLETVYGHLSKSLVDVNDIVRAGDVYKRQCQACMMAPTEILATQHYATVMEFLKDMDIRVALLTGSTKKKERNKILPAIASGEIQIVIGTHALIEETVVFSSLGLAIIDEQHRFGVEQRSRLWKKNAVVPHVLVMTATPIPRTLAMTLYGDLDVSVIDELPPGRKPIPVSYTHLSNMQLAYIIRQ